MARFLALTSLSLSIVACSGSQSNCGRVGQHCCVDNSNPNAPNAYCNDSTCVGDVNGICECGRLDERCCSGTTPCYGSLQPNLLFDLICTCSTPDGGP